MPNLSYLALSEGFDGPCQMGGGCLPCVQAIELIGRLFQTFAACRADTGRSEQLNLAFESLRASLRRQLLLDEELLLPTLFQALSGHHTGGGPSDIGRALFEHVRADHAGCLALLAQLEQPAPDDESLGCGQWRNSVVAVLQAYVLPHLCEITTLFPHLAAAGVDVPALHQRMAERQLELSRQGQTSPAT